MAWSFSRSSPSLTRCALILAPLGYNIGSTFRINPYSKTFTIASLSFIRVLPSCIGGPVEAGTPPRLGVYVFWLSRIHFNLFPELIDHHAQRFRLLAILRPPHGLQQPAMRNGPSVGDHQFLQHSEFLWRQMNGHPAHQNV